MTTVTEAAAGLLKWCDEGCLSESAEERVRLVCNHILAAVPEPVTKPEPFKVGQRVRATMGCSSISGRNTLEADSIQTIERIDRPGLKFVGLSGWFPPECFEIATEPLTEPPLPPDPRIIAYAERLQLGSFWRGTYRLSGSECKAMAREFYEGGES